jgi:hypothetical protein
MRKKQNPQSSSNFLGAKSPPPTIAETRDELIVFWDPFSPLSPKGIRMAMEQSSSLEAIGIAEVTAMTFINKYNSMIMRGPGAGPLVTTKQARTWASAPMVDIVAAVFERAQP